MMSNKNIIRICDCIIQMTEQDVKDLEGAEFTGKVVSEMFGRQAAAIITLADLIKTIIQKSGGGSLNS